MADRTDLAEGTAQPPVIASESCSAGCVLHDRLVTVAMLLLLAALAWRSINYVTPTAPGKDSSLYVSETKHLMAGRVLYRDLWQQRMPMIYIVNYAGMCLGDGTLDSVRFLERFFAVGAVLLMFGTVLYALGSRWLALLASMLFLIHQYSPNVFQGGNLTEEYGIVFALGAVWALIAARRAAGRRAAVLCFLAGLLLSLAALTKEPLLLPAFPWFLYGVAFRGDGWKNICSRVALTVAGAAIPLGMLVAYLVANNAFAGFVDVLSFNFSFAASGSKGSLLGKLHDGVAKLEFLLNTSLIASRLMFAFGLISLFHRPFLRRTGYVAVPAIGSTVLGLGAAFLGWRFFQHYFMMFIPFFVIVSACGVALAVDLLSGLVASRRKVAAAVAMMVVILDGGNLFSCVKRLAAPTASRYPRHEFTPLVLRYTQPDEPIYCLSGNTFALYAETGRLCPYKQVAVNKASFRSSYASTREQKMERFRADLRGRPPSLITLDEHTTELLEEYLAGWLEKHYRHVATSSDGRDTVWLRRDRPFTQDSQDEDAGT